MRARERPTALLLSGAGARAAYEVGVLRALAELTASSGQRAPFSIYCGVSAGALNATRLALAADDFAGGVRWLTSFWRGLHVGDIYRASGRWLPGVAGLLLGRSRGLFDSTPLARRLEQDFDFSHLERAISSHALRALCITCLGHGSGQSVSFFQGRSDLEPWRQGSRVGAHVALGHRHVLAAMATPFLFPAEKLNREYFGDGAVSGSPPLSPPLHLGAERIVVIGTGLASTDDNLRSAQGRYPRFGEMAGRMLSAVDTVTDDVGRLLQVNKLLESIPAASRDQLPWRPIDCLVLKPSRRLESLAVEAMDDLPRTVRSLLARLEDGNSSGSLLASHLFFEPAYLEKLIDLGYRDGLAQSEAINQFFLVSRID
jgi:NTE family protein